MPSTDFTKYSDDELVTLVNETLSPYPAVRELVARFEKLRAREPQASADPAGKFYVWESSGKEHWDALFWKPDSLGYTRNLDEAGLYDQEDAAQLEARGREDIAVPYALARGLARPLVDRDTLRDALKWQRASASVDWSAFGAEGEGACARCATPFSTHAKIRFAPNVGIVSRKPCPTCGTYRLARFSAEGGDE